MNATHLIKTLQLQPHPEGGYYQETYRCAEMTTTSSGVMRNVSTAIYYLLMNEDISHFHRIKSDELWFFHQGMPMEIVVIKNGTIHTIVLGNDVENGERPQAIIEAGCWFAAGVKGRYGYSLVSCMVAPGFDFADFEMAKRAALLYEYPLLKEVIEAFTERDQSR